MDLTDTRDKIRDLMGDITIDTTEI
jgi:hypothetical protein